MGCSFHLSDLNMCLPLVCHLHLWDLLSSSFPVNRGTQATGHQGKGHIDWSPIKLQRIHLCLLLLLQCITRQSWRLWLVSYSSTFSTGPGIKRTTPPHNVRRQGKASLGLFELGICSNQRAYKTGGTLYAVTTNPSYFFTPSITNPFGC